MIAPSRAAYLPRSRLRADAQLNRERVLAGARTAVASSGFEVSYHEIARRAGVGVGTVYRRYPDRAALLEAVLLDIVDDLTSKADAAGSGPDAWASFTEYFKELVGDVRENTGLSDRLDGGGEHVAAARERLFAAGERLCARARAAGLRPDLGWPDIFFLALVAGREPCAADPQLNEDRRARSVTVILDGLRARPEARHAAT